MGHEIHDGEPGFAFSRLLHSRFVCSTSLALSGISDLAQLDRLRLFAFPTILAGPGPVFRSRLRGFAFSTLEFEQPFEQSGPFAILTTKRTRPDTRTPSKTTLERSFCRNQCSSSPISYVLLECFTGCSIKRALFPPFPSRVWLSIPCCGDA